MDPLADPSHPQFSYETSPQLFLFTSLTAGSSHTITATSRLELILKANRIAFRAIDCATDEKARRIWGRRAGKRKLPGLVREGMVLADLEAVEDWNEYGELKMQLNASTAPPTQRGSPAPQEVGKDNQLPAGGVATLPIREQVQPRVDQSGDQDVASSSSSPGATSQRDIAEPTSSKDSSSTSTAVPTPLHPSSLPAGPAKTSGLDAVTTDPKAMEAAMGGKAPEAKTTAARVKFSEDQMKGDARDARAAEDSVGD